MANRIFLEYTVIDSDVSRSGRNLTIDQQTTSTRANSTVTIEATLTQDITIQAESEFQSASEFVPSFLNEVLTLMRVVSSAGGSVGTGFADFMNKLDAPFWVKTPPVKIQTQLAFFTKTDSFKDVVEPVTQIVGLSILSRDPNNSNKFILPGINLRNMRNFSSDAIRSQVVSTKLLSLEIPGIIYLPVCMIRSAVPTFSSEVTESSNPLWATIDIAIEGVAPASTDMFVEAIDSKLKMQRQLNYSDAKTKSIFN
jgi:hypothetical protein